MEDLGQWWEETTGAPIPLGNILLRRDFGALAPDGIEAILRASLQYAREHTDEVMEYVREHAQELDERVMKA